MLAKGERHLGRMVKEGDDEGLWVNCNSGTVPGSMNVSVES